MQRLSVLLEGPERSLNRAMYLAADGGREGVPRVKVYAFSWGGSPCNYHIKDKGEEVQRGSRDAGLAAHIVGLPGVNDAIAMGTTGMEYSLISRDNAAFGIQANMEGTLSDAAVIIPGCDKNFPAALIAAALYNRPTVVIPGGTIGVGKSQIDGRALALEDAAGAGPLYVAGKFSDEQYLDVLRNACPKGGGGCASMATMSTMSANVEVMGFGLPYTALIPATDPRKMEECYRVGNETIVQMLNKGGPLPRELMSRESFENAITITNGLGGSTNAVLHLMAMAKAAGVRLTYKDFRDIGRKSPYLAELRPSGDYAAADLFDIGGIPGVLKMYLDEGLLHGDVPTVTGATLRENIETLAARLRPGQIIVHGFDDPISPIGHLRILEGNMGNAVGKITGLEGTSFEGPAQVYRSEQAIIDAAQGGNIPHGTAIVLAGYGPRERGMPELLDVTSTLMKLGLSTGDNPVALISDGRFSGGSHGFIVGHVAPEAAAGGTIGLIRNGDNIRIDADADSIDVLVSDAELSSRRNKEPYVGSAPPPGARSNYARTVAQADEGCVTW